MYVIQHQWVQIRTMHDSDTTQSCRETGGSGGVPTVYIHPQPGMNTHTDTYPSTDTYPTINIYLITSTYPSACLYPGPSTIVVLVVIVVVIPFTRVL